MGCTDLALRPKLSFGIAHEAQPAQHWTGEFCDVVNDGQSHILKLAASIYLIAGVIEGRGTISVIDGSRAFTLSGELSGAEAAFDVWIDEIDIPPFRCTTILSADESRLTGTWSFSCGDPVNCGCGSYSGPMWMQRTGQIPADLQRGPQ
jgi:hypothetical protein